MGRIAIVTLMVLCGLAMWIVNPALWLWITSWMQSGTQPRMGPYAVLLLGITLTCVALAKAMSALNRRYERLTGNVPTIHVIRPWRRSLRGGRSRRRETDGRLPVSAIDVIMVVSVVLAIAAFTSWFAITNPTPPGAGGPGPAKH